MSWSGDKLFALHEQLATNSTLTGIWDSQVNKFMDTFHMPRHDFHNHASTATAAGLVLGGLGTSLASATLLLGSPLPPIEKAFLTAASAVIIPTLSYACGFILEETLVMQKALTTAKALADITIDTQTCGCPRPTTQ